MSEYQYYEFAAIDRPLIAKQMDEVRKWSSRAEITPTSFVNEYHYGDFRGDPGKLLEEYYDAFFYTSNWGSRRLMLRLPKDLFDKATCNLYEIEDVLEFRSTTSHLLVEFKFDDCDSDREFDYQENLDRYVDLRSQLLRGDLRPFYLAWLHAIEFGVLPEDALEPPVPPGLQKLEPAQRALVNYYSITPGLVLAAAQGNTGAAPKDQTTEQLLHWLKALEPTEKDQLLTQLLLNEPVDVRHTTMARFRKATARTAELPPDAQRRVAADLLANRDAFQALVRQRHEEE